MGPLLLETEPAIIEYTAVFQYEVPMTYRGHIKNGVVVLDQAVQLPEGAEVEVAVQPLRPSSQPQQASTLLERFGSLVGSCPDLPPDMAENHDHYLHGREKK